MDLLEFILIFIILMLCIYFIIYIYENNYYYNDIKPNINKIINNNNNKYYNNKYNNNNTNENVYLEGTEQTIENDGYINELMFKNNLKEGDYINQFKEPLFYTKTDNQIGFNPIPKEKTVKLPYANININCMDD